MSKPRLRPVLTVNNRQFSGRHNGFSYVEIVFAVAMLAILALTATPYLEKNIQRKKELALKQNLREIRTAIDAYKAAYDAGKMTKTMGDSGYPKRLEDLVNGIEDVKDPQKKKIYFLRRLPADPMFAQGEFRGNLSENRADEAIDPADTWGKRSYDSDAENPREGSDVYDVYSFSEEVGINGIPYAKW